VAPGPYGSAPFISNSATYKPVWHNIISKPLPWGVVLHVRSDVCCISPLSLVFEHPFSVKCVVSLFFCNFPSALLLQINSSATSLSISFLPFPVCLIRF